jgi:hypothetical protein
MTDLDHLILGMTDVELHAILGMLAARHPETASEITSGVLAITRKDK